MLMSGGIRHENVSGWLDTIWILSTMSTCLKLTSNCSFEYRVSQKMSHGYFCPISVLQVRLYFFTRVLESEFQAQNCVREPTIFSGHI